MQLKLPQKARERDKRNRVWTGSTGVGARWCGLRCGFEPLGVGQGFTAQRQWPVLCICFSVCLVFVKRLKNVYGYLVPGGGER